MYEFWIDGALKSTLNRLDLVLGWARIYVNRGREVIVYEKDRYDSSIIVAKYVWNDKTSSLSRIFLKQKRTKSA